MKKTVFHKVLDHLEKYPWHDKREVSEAIGHTPSTIAVCMYHYGATFTSEKRRIIKEKCGGENV